MKNISILVLSSIFLFSCGTSSTNEEVKNKITKEDYTKFRNENQRMLDDLSASIVQAMLMADTVEITDTFLLTTKHLGFTPVMGTHTEEGSPDSAFNAIWVGSYAHGLPLPEGMKEDYFKSECLLNLRDVKEGKTPDEYGLGEGDSRSYSTGYAFVQAMKQLQYVVVVHPLSFTAGAVYMSSRTFDPAVLDAVIMIYDVKNKKVCGARKVHVSGPQEISYSFDAPSTGNGYADKEDQAALYKFEIENRDVVFRNTMKTLGALIDPAEVY